MTHREFFDSEWYKDGTKQLCADGWPTFVVPINIKIRNILEDYENLQKENAILREALEFYADGDSWGHESPTSTTYSVVDREDLGTGEFDFNDITDDERVGGRRARQALEKVK